jgi:hypothetical protein
MDDADLEAAWPLTDPTLRRTPSWSGADRHAAVTQRGETKE